ncbi:MAG TPA: translation initiation factor IF-3 [Nitrospirales bacterium]|nr:translation initiation factor IF-3 [Nitrospirales bacterium]
MVQKLRVNQRIRTAEVRVIGSDGEQLGILPTPDAIRQALEDGYDLVEVAPMAQPPVCRIMDYGKYKYETNKKEHANRSHQKSTQVKEAKIRLRTGIHDLETKIKHINSFLDHGHKTKVILVFRGREMEHAARGRNLMELVVQGIADHGQVEQPQRIEGRFLVMLLAPKS